MNKYTVLSIIIILITVALSFYIIGYKTGSEQTNHNQEVKRDTTWLTFTDTLFLDKPVPMYVYDSIPSGPVDTAAIIADYLKAKQYTDTLVSNSDLMAVLSETVYQNSVLNREFSYQITYPVITRQVEKPFSVYVVGDSRINLSMMISRRQWVIMGGYSFSDRVPFAGIGFKLY